MNFRWEPLSNYHLGQGASQVPRESLAGGVAVVSVLPAGARVARLTPNNRWPLWISPDRSVNTGRSHPEGAGGRGGARAPTS